MDYKKYENSPYACKICMQDYDDESRIPMVILCGHTICGTCIKSIRSTIKNGRNYSCPFCMQNISKETEPKKNWEIFNFINSKKDDTELCEEHKEKLRFVCVDCSSLICQICLYDFHLGHKIDKSDGKQVNKIKDIITDIHEKFKSSNFESDTRNLISRENSLYQKCADNLKNLYNNIKVINLIEMYDYLLSKENFDVEKTSFEKMLKNKKSDRNKELNNYELKFGEIYERFSDKIEASGSNSNLNNSTSGIQYNFLKKKRNLDSKVQILESLNTQLNNLESSLVSDSDKYFKIYESFKDIKKEKLEDYLTTLDYRNIGYKTSKSNRNTCLFSDLQKTLKIENNYIVEIFKSIDRKDFCSTSDNPYEDEETSFGIENLKVHSPTHCLNTLNFINIHFPFRKGIKKILDVGSGSGYFTLCLSKFFGPNSITYGIDHKQEIINLSVDNINKYHSNYLKSERIRFILEDARNGIPDEGPFDVIHFGISHHEIPPKIIDQLAIGGIIIIPIELTKKSYYQQFTLCKKEENGTLTKTEIDQVKIDKLTDLDQNIIKGKSHQRPINSFYLLGEDDEEVEDIPYKSSIKNSNKRKIF